MSWGKTRARLVAPAVAGATMLVAACTLLNPLDAYGPPRGTSPGDAGPNGPGADAAHSLAKWPDPPAKDDGTGSAKLIFAVASFGPGNTPGSPAVGYDLDGVATCPPPPSCAPSAASTSHQCDDDGGVDNGGTNILAEFLTLTGKTDAVTTAVSEGRGGFLLVLDAYNGTQNDTQVSVSIFPSNGTQPANPDDNSPPPRHDGTDVWTIDSTALFGGDAGPPYVSKTSDIKAYVSGGVLVAKLELSLNLSDLVFDLRGTVITARIVNDAGPPRLVDGVIDGRWPTKSLLSSLDSLKDPFDSTGDTGLCGSSQLYQSIKQKACANVDISKDPSKDNASPPVPCDAVALVIEFTGESALMGDIMDNKPPRHFCGVGYSDDCP